MAKNQGGHRRVISASDNLRIDCICTDGTKSTNIKYENIIMLRCRVCCKFIKKNYGKWHCPHCGISFVEGIDKEDIEDTEEIMMYMDEIKDIGGW